MRKATAPPEGKGHLTIPHGKEDDIDALIQRVNANKQYKKAAEVSTPPVYTNSDVVDIFSGIGENTSTQEAKTPLSQEAPEVSAEEKGAQRVADLTGALYQQRTDRLGAA